MSEHQFDDDYISNLMSIEEEQIRLLKRKAQSLKSELDKTNLLINNSDHKNYHFDDFTKTSKIEKKNTLKSSFDKSSLIQNITKKNIFYFYHLLFF